MEQEEQDRQNQQVELGSSERAISITKNATTARWNFLPSRCIDIDYIIFLQEPLRVYLKKFPLLLIIFQINSEGSNFDG